MIEYPEEEFYSGEGIFASVEDDEITTEEEGFMAGYLAA